METPAASWVARALAKFLEQTGNAEPTENYACAFVEGGGAV